MLDLKQYGHTEIKPLSKEKSNREMEQTKEKGDMLNNDN